MATSKINRAFFFKQVRANLFDGKLRQAQVDGLEAILDHWETKHADRDDRWLAYLLATAHHETDRTLQPIREYGTTAYFTRRYDPPPAGENPKIARELGNKEPGDGVRFRGRGFVQLTGRRNYADWGRRLDIDLIGDPDRALKIDIAARILIDGAILGTFTGLGLDDFLNRMTSDWRGARKVINKLDKADLIASLAQRYYAAISYTS